MASSNEIWQRLLLLESRDLVTQLFQEIHGRELSAVRAKEIGAGARQAREYFRHAESADFSVRPLLAFYGAASLARALTLLLRPRGGEECLTRGHGIETIGWSNSLSGDLSSALCAIAVLKIRTTAGLFQDLLNATQNRMCVRVRSEAVDGQIQYDIPAIGQEISFFEILERLPDLRPDLLRAKRPLRFARINEVKLVDGVVSATVAANEFSSFQHSYAALGYTISAGEQITGFSGVQAARKDAIPQFLHTYVQKAFGAIPSLHVVEPFDSSVYYSQIAVTYLAAYVLGMLARYFPTHWTAMTAGSKGDGLWPTLNRAQHYVESAFPELVTELIDNVIAVPLQRATSSE